MFRHSTAGSSVSGNPSADKVNEQLAPIRCNALILFITRSSRSRRGPRLVLGTGLDALRHGPAVGLQRVAVVNHGHVLPRMTGNSAPIVEACAGLAAFSDAAGPGVAIPDIARD